MYRRSGWRLLLHSKRQRELSSRRSVRQTSPSKKKQKQKQNKQNKTKQNKNIPKQNKTNQNKEKITRIMPVFPRIKGKFPSRLAYRNQEVIKIQVVSISAYSYLHGRMLNHIRVVMHLFMDIFTNKPKEAIYTYIIIYLCTHIHVFSRACIHANTHTCLHMMHIYIHKCIRTSIHTMKLTFERSRDPFTMNIIHQSIFTDYV